MIKIAVSACLLGQNVRYDGGNKFINFTDYFNKKKYQLHSICPEVEMGLSIPRKPIQIIKKQNQIQLVQVEDQNINHTHQMESWFNNSLNQIKGFHGFVLKSKSPSCGFNTTPLYNGENIEDKGDGYFVYLLKKHIKQPLIIDELGLKNPSTLSAFKHSLVDFSNEKNLR